MATRDERRKALQELHVKCTAALAECEQQMKDLENEGGGNTKALSGCKSIGDAVKVLADAGDIRSAIMATRMDAKQPGQA